MFSLLALMMQGPVFDIEWIEERAQLRGAWERCVQLRVVEMTHLDRMPSVIAAQAMATCQVARGAYKYKVASIAKDEGEVAIKMAEADSAIHREATRWAAIEKGNLSH